MKKIVKLFALITTLAFITGGGMLTSCSSGSSGGGDEQEKQDDSKDKDKTDQGNAGNQYLAENITVEELSKMTPIPESGKTTKLKAGSYSIWAGKGAVVTLDDKMAIQINTGKETPVAIVSATNMTGTNATAVPVVGNNLKSIMKDASGNPVAEDSAPVNYVLVDVPKAGKTSIKLNISVDASTKDLPEEGLSYWVLATDLNGTILAVKDLGDIKSTASEYVKKDIDLGTAVLSDKLCLGFARGAGSGGLKIHSITLTETAKSAAASKPNPANFAVTKCTTSDQNDGKITISNETASSLEYKYESDSNWADLTNLELANLKAGKYAFRYRETDDILASEEIIVEVEKWVDESKVFAEFIASSVSSENVDTAKEFSAEDSTWSVSSAKYQLKDSKGNDVTYTTYDYDEASEKGYKYTGRIKIQKDASFKIKTKAGTVIRFDGGSPSTGTERKLAITGADKTEWAASTNGSFWLKASADEVSLTANGEFNIYGIHVESAEVEDTLSKTGYANLELSVKKGEEEVASCLVNDEVKATVTVKKTETYISGKMVVTDKLPVTSEVSWAGATVSETGVVATSVAGKLTIKATYTYGTGESDKLEVTKELDVSAGFTPKTETVANDEDTLGIVAASATSSAESVATVTVDGGIKITSVAAGSATITCTSSDGKTATIDVEVSAGGDITTTVHKGGAEVYVLDLGKVKELGKITASSKKLDDIISVYAVASGKSIEGKDTYIQLTGGGAKASESDAYGLQITLTKKAKITITALSKESKSACQWLLANADNSKSVESSGEPATASAKGDVITTAPATLAFESVTAGVYYLGAKADGGYLTSLKIEY